MKVVNVEAMLVALPFEHGAPKPARHNFGFWETQDVLLVRIDTDTGITGWGEAFSIGGASLTLAAIRDYIAPLALGKSVESALDLAKELPRTLYTIARGGPVTFGLSGFDMALWDIAGKAAGKPVWELLGGAPIKSLDAYASLHRLNKVEYVSKVCRDAVDRGYKHIKLHEHSVEAVAAAREAVGNDITLMVDTNCFWSSVPQALAACREFERYNVAWLEEPLFAPDDYDQMSLLRRDAGIPIAGGENLGDFNDVRWMIEAKAVDVVQPSAAKLGGISVVWRAMEFAATRNVRAVPHSPFVGPALVATIHMIAASGQNIPCEHRYCQLEASLIGDSVLSVDGRLNVPDGPGLGFEVDAETLRKYRVA